MSLAAAQAAMPAARGLAAAATPSGFLELVLDSVLRAGWPAASILTAWALGVFRDYHIRGPRRTDEDEPTAVLLLILLAGLSAMFLGAAGAAAILTPHGQTIAGQVHFTPTQEIVVETTSSAAVVFVIVTMTVSMRPRGLHYLGLERGGIMRGILIGIVALAIAWPLVMLVSQFMEWFCVNVYRFNPAEHELLDQVQNSSRAGKALGVVVAVVLAPLSEELVFRGYFQTILRRWLSPWTAVIVASALFAMAHDAWSQPAIFLLALCLGYVYERTGNLWANITMHSLFNLTSVALFILGSH
jgi:membrane protease YdiL (CAAX protease family)